MVTDRRTVDRLAALIVNVGGAVPFGVLDPGDPTRPEVVGSVVLAIAAVALLLAVTIDARGPLIVWSVRLAGAVWLAAAIAVAVAGDVPAPTRVAWVLILAGLALSNLLISDRLYRGDTTDDRS